MSKNHKVERLKAYLDEHERRAADPASAVGDRIHVLNDLPLYASDIRAVLARAEAERDRLREALERVERASEHYAALTEQETSFDAIRHAHESTAGIARAALAALADQEARQP